ncbi:MAG: hypothetical protein A2161_18745 [Candidatus Schekmanbacteria bacterium RBG_13_48_7]|uniref:Serine protease n=1 Tax=Candidatus Schekmanbacteria bacterium RBG_13_48_7 TaxID=1817878 RepID=A0A1F7S0E9_9BACT|nr:MAG: hypothetical protein A2161_18745 [Candidatus Schekmanbacteria bacterium RBG_13_48_7]
MGVMDIFWIFIILMALQPALKKRMLESARMRLMQRLEKKHKSRFILMIHRQETMSILGFPLIRYIDINDSEEVIRAIHMTDDDVPIDLVLHTPGGLVLASTQIAYALKDHKAKVTVFVPHYAMSGGTLIALAADEIIMDQHAVLGPVDPQLAQYPAASLLTVLRDKEKKDIDDDTLIKADMAHKALAQLKDTVIYLLSGKMGKEKAEKLAEILSQGTWTHDYPITCQKAAELGLPITCNLDQDIYQLMNLFPQPVRSYASVEYFPKPYKSAPH